MDHQLPGADAFVNQRDVAVEFCPVASEHLQMQQAAAQQAALRFQRQRFFQIGHGGVMVPSLAPMQVAAILQGVGEARHQRDGLVKTLQRFVNPPQVPEQYGTAGPGIGIARVHRQHRFMIRQRRGVPAQRPQGRAPAHQRRRFAGMGGQKTVETGSGFGEVVLTQQGQAVMQQRGGIAWIDRQRPADQLDGFATVALLQPQHSQQIECGKDAGVEPENFPVKRFRFGQAALLVARRCAG